MNPLSAFSFIPGLIATAGLLLIVETLYQEGFVWFLVGSLHFRAG